MPLLWSFGGFLVWRAINMAHRWCCRGQSGNSGCNSGVKQFDRFLDQWIVFESLAWFRGVGSTRHNSVFRNEFDRPIASARFIQQRFQLPTIVCAGEIDR